MRRYVPGRVSRLLLMILLLAAAYGAGYWSAGAAPAVIARLAAWSEPPVDAGRPPARAELGPAGRARLGRLSKGGGR